LVKRTVRGVDEAVEVNDVLWVKRSRSMACSRAGGGSVLQVKRWRSWVKRSSDVEGEVVEATTCSWGEVLEGVLRRQQRAPSVGVVEVLKCASGKILLSVKRATRAPDIYIGGKMRDTRSLRCVTHFLSASRIIFR
jgi:hypothetical protein